MLWTVVVLCAAMLVGVLLVIPRRILPRYGGRPTCPRWTACGPSSAPGVPRAGGGVRPQLRRDDGLHLVLAVRLPERRRPLRGRLRARVRRQRRRAHRSRLGGQPPRGPVVAAQHGAHGRRGPGLAGTVAFLVLAVADVPPWPAPVPIFVAVASNGAIMGNSAALAMAQVRPGRGYRQRGPRLRPVRARRPRARPRRPGRRAPPSVVPRRW